MFVGFKRVLRTGILSFWRNAFVSLSAIAVLIVTLFVIGSLVFNNALLSASLDELREKVDINIYFTTEAMEPDILSLRKSLESFPEVEKVTYISREEALSNFKERHKDDARMLQALDELDDNPLGAVLNVKTKDPSQYESVAEFLESTPVLSESGDSVIDKVNYSDNKVAIDRLSDIISASEKSNFAKTLILAIISIVVTFNTIRLVIFTAKDEISVMKLVGASNSYTRGPFVVAGILYGLLAAIITIIIFYPLTYWFGPLFYPFPLFLSDNVGDLALFQYYISNLLELLFVVIFSGVVLGGLSSYLAVRRYLR